MAASSRLPQVISGCGDLHGSQSGLHDLLSAVLSMICVKALETKSLMLVYLTLSLSLRSLLLL